MFKNNSFEQELIDGMRKSLIGNQVENKYSFDKISKATDYLNSAAEILDDTGMYAEAEVLTKLLEKIANKKYKDFNYSEDEWEEEDENDSHREELASNNNKKMEEKQQQFLYLKENYLKEFKKVADALFISIDEAIRYYLSSSSAEASDLEDFESLKMTVDFEKRYQKRDSDMDPI